jgi:hypothetical protein
VELRWWAVAIAGLACLTLCIALATLLPMPRVRQRLRPLAHVDRLTGLPEYARVVRMQWWSLLVTAVLLVIVFLAALLASSRPVGFSSTNHNLGAASPEDIMLCVGAPVTEPATAGFLNYFARQVKSFDTQRIGLTSSTMRVVPLTRDHQYASDRFSRFAALAGVQRNVDAKKPVPDPGLAELRAGVDEFSPSLTYVDYAPSVEDILALCMAGFPHEDKSTHRRSLIYWGDSNIRGLDEQRPALFSAQQVKDMAVAAGIQINAVTRAGLPDPALQGVNSLHSIASGTGGSFEIYNPVGTDVDTSGGTSPTLAATLGRIRANPPPLAAAGRTSLTAGSWDDPNVPLIAGVVVGALLCMSLVVLRR